MNHHYKITYRLINSSRLLLQTFATLADAIIGLNYLRSHKQVVDITTNFMDNKQW